MTRKSTTCSRSSRANGLTLIEVVAAIAILGTVLVGVVLAKSRHARQIALTQRRFAAVRAADELIAGWWAGAPSVPIGQSGVIASDKSMAWQTLVVENEAIAQLGSRVVRVEIREADPAGQRSDSANDVLLAVDLVLPEERMDAAPSTDEPVVGTDAEPARASTPDSIPATGGKERL